MKVMKLILSIIAEISQHWFNAEKFTVPRLKSIEQQLGIPRHLASISGLDACHDGSIKTWLPRIPWRYY